MKTFRVITREVYLAEYHIDADSKEDAEEYFSDGEYAGNEFISAEIYSVEELDD